MAGDGTQPSLGPTLPRTACLTIPDSVRVGTLLSMRGPNRIGLGASRPGVHDEITQRFKMIRGLTGTTSPKVGHLQRQT